MDRRQFMFSIATGALAATHLAPWTRAFAASLNESRNLWLVQESACEFRLERACENLFERDLDGFPISRNYLQGLWKQLRASAPDAMGANARSVSKSDFIRSREQIMRAAFAEFELPATLLAIYAGSTGLWCSHEIESLQDLRDTLLVGADLEKRICRAFGARFLPIAQLPQGIERLASIERLAVPIELLSDRQFAGSNPRTFTVYKRYWRTQPVVTWLVSTARDSQALLRFEAIQSEVKAKSQLGYETFLVSNSATSDRAHSNSSLVIQRGLPCVVEDALNSLFLDFDCMGKAESSLDAT